MALQIETEWTWETGWIWNLFGELIDYALEQMADDPDQSYTSVKWEHYMQALTSSGIFYSKVFHLIPDSFSDTLDR